MCKVLLMLDKFFLKYEGGIKLTPPQEKLPSKSPALLGLKCLLFINAFLIVLSSFPFCRRIFKFLEMLACVSPFHRALKLCLLIFVLRVYCIHFIVVWLAFTRRSNILTSKIFIFIKPLKIQGSWKKCTLSLC